VIPNLDDFIKNIDFVRKFYGCENERGFILVHVAIVSKTHKQVEGVRLLHEGARTKNREMYNQGLQKIHAFHDEVYKIFNMMWEESNPSKYLDYRTFIMGITGNKEIFPNGVVYKGCFDDKP